MMTNNEYEDLSDIQFHEIWNPNHKKHKSYLVEILSYISVIVIAVILAYIFTNFVILNAYIPSGSMEKDRLIAFRLAYEFSDPKRGDVVVFKYPDDESVAYIKRVIGLPGDTVVIKSGLVYVNGNALDEPYIKEPMIDNNKELTFHVPEGCYFMLGDNRNNSKDSRYWINPYVEKDKIMAKAIFIYYDKKVTFQLI